MFVYMAHGCCLKIDSVHGKNESKQKRSHNLNLMGNLFRAILLCGLAASIDNTDDDYGVRTSMRRFKECREVQHV